MSFDFRQNISREIFEQKYNLHGEESVEEVFGNIAEEIAEAEEGKAKKEEWKRRFYEELVNTRFIPGGRIIANARPFSRMKNYNNCFTIKIPDSMEGIYSSLAEDATISKMGGGVGFNISSLRPKGSSLSKGGESSGPISFLKVFNESAKIIMTGGQRRAAHLGVMNIDHPDIEEFITIKQGDNNKELTQFNISVGITDDFINAVQNDENWDLKYNGKVYKTVRARDLYNKIVENAYEHNEPGIFNIDNVNRNNNGWYKHFIQEANPCLTGDCKIKIKDTNGRTYEDTLVKIIERYKAGDIIYTLSYNESNNQKEWKKILWGGKTKEQTEIMTIETEDGGSIDLTPDHLVYEKDKGWIEAKDIVEGDDIVSIKDNE